MPKTNEKIKIRLRKDDEGFYDKDDLLLLDPIDMLNILIDETSCQDTMNIVRTGTFGLLGLGFDIE